jgi:uncharacterized protein (TIGR02145 family)
LQYQLTTLDLTKYIRFSVTPVEQSSGVPGFEVKSPTYTGPIINSLCGQPVTDTRDGQSYETVLIGNQCWMAENLNYGVMLDSCSDQSNNGIIEKYCYNNNPANCLIYGGLYRWQEQQMQLCPNGWHIPTKEEFNTLWNYLGSNAGGAMKEQGTVHWNSPNAGATNLSGFNALPAGSASFNYLFPCHTRTFLSLGTDTWYLTSDLANGQDPNGGCYNYNSQSSLDYWLNYNTAELWRNCELIYSDDAFSVRCIKDDPY